MPDPAIKDALTEWGQRYNPETGLVREELHSPGYHTRIPDGEWVHSTRTNLHYAVLLLRAGGPVNNARAAEIIAKILTLQDVDPVSRTYGIWSWFVEEPLARMAPPDWNWADFCGAALGHVLVEHAAQISPELLAGARAGLGHAAWAIFRRNVGPDYTNIAVMGAGVCALAGEQLGEPRLLDYGRRRLARFLAHTRFHGGFNEYNSPTYTLVALNELERILQLVSDPAVRADAETLRRMTWESIAEHFHPATAQWAGPHSRAYFDRLDAGGAAYLSKMTGAPLRCHPECGDFHEIEFTRPIPCPEDLRGRFLALPQADAQIVRSFIRRRDGGVYVEGTTWLAEEICLGSANIDSLWTQRRPLIAYWRTSEDPAVVLRLRFLKDGRDFASMYVVNRQQRNRVLSAVGVAAGMGDFHLYLDAPAEGGFQAADLRLRYELYGQDAWARTDGAAFELGAGGWVGPDWNCLDLGAGGWRARVSPTAGRFAGQDLRWECGGENARAWVDAVCYQGVEREFHLKECGDMVLAAGLELLAAGEAGTGATPEWSEKGGRIQAAWGGLGIELPLGLAPPPVDTSIYRD